MLHHRSAHRREPNIYLFVLLFYIFYLCQPFLLCPWVLTKEVFTALRFQWILFMLKIGLWFWTGSKVHSESVLASFTFTTYKYFQRTSKRGLLPRPPRSKLLKKNRSALWGMESQSKEYRKRKPKALSCIVRMPLLFMTTGINRCLYLNSVRIKTEQNEVRTKTILNLD